jgi:hypothetical protein
VLILPLLGDGLADLPPEAELPAPFRPHLAPRAPAAAPGLVARRHRAPRGDRCEGSACGRSRAPLPGTMQLPLHDDGSSSRRLWASRKTASPQRAGARGDRRGVLALATIAVVLAGGWGAWRWWQRPTDRPLGRLAHAHRPRGAPSSRDGTPMLVTLTQKDRSVVLVSIVGIANDPAMGRACARPGRSAPASS